MRKALPILTIITVALLGCTTNRTPGNGQPVTTSPSMSPADTYGSSSGGNVPMTSSYLTPSTSRVDHAAYAAEVMRQHQQYQPRLLGYLNPEPRIGSQQPVQDYPTGQFINPSLTANPQITVNSSISSQPYPVIAGGDAVGVSTDGGFVVAGGTSTTGTTTGSAALTAPLSTAGATVGTGTRILTPTMSSGVTPSPLATSGAITPVGTTTSTLNTNIVAPLNVSTTPTGQVMITNVRTAATGK
jgi:hypothetical protein